MQHFAKKNIVYEIILVTILLIIAFTIRYEGFKNGGRYTFDEALYASMARDMRYNINMYNGISYATKYLQWRPGRKLPDYLFKKLFKHPPMYCYLLMMSYSLHEKFGLAELDLMHQAVKASITTGVLTIIVLYLIGRLLFSPLVGLLAAVFLVVDPVHWITSQKVWMDTTLTFYMTLSGLFYLFALRKKDGDLLFYILTGLAVGGAALTKYPGGMVFLSILLFTFFFRRGLLKTPKWLAVPISMLLMLLHWFFWNLEVYGLNHFIGKGKGFEDIRRGFKVMGKVFPLIILVLAIAGGAYYFWKKYREKHPEHHNIQIPDVLRKRLFWLGMFFAIILIIVRKDLGYIFHALSFKYEPTTSWKMGFFADEPWYFYFRRLFIYFPIYLFGYISLCFYPYKEKNRVLLPLFYLGIIIPFFIFWGNYQSRYFLPAVPWLLLLSAYMVEQFHAKISALSNKNMKIALYVLLWGTVVFCIAKAIQVDMLLAWTNKPCYF